MYPAKTRSSTPRSSSHPPCALSRCVAARVVREHRTRPSGCRPRSARSSARTPGRWTPPRRSAGPHRSAPGDSSPHRCTRTPITLAPLDARPARLDAADHQVGRADVRPAARRRSSRSPMLNTRRSSSSAHAVIPSQPNTAGRSHAPASIRAPTPRREHASEVPRDPAARHVGERAHVGPRAQRADVVEVADGRRSSRSASNGSSPTIRRTSEKPFAWMPAEASPSTTSPGSTRLAVDQVAAVDDADDGAAEVELVLAVDPRQLRRLAAEDRASRRAAHVGGALDELGDLLRVDRVGGDVVEEEERLGSRRQDVVDPVRGEVGAAPTELSRSPAEDELRADRVGRGGEQALVVDRDEAGESPEAADDAARPCRLHGVAQAADDRVGGCEGDPRGGVRLLVRRHGASVVDRPGRA